VRIPPLSLPFARLLLAGALGLLPGLARAACDLPLPSAAGTAALPRVAAALDSASPQLDVLVVGSATVLGGHDRPSGGFPEAMAAALQAARPGLRVNLTVHGKRGEMATTMLALLRHELGTRPFALVVWQTGTVEAVRHVPPASFAVTVAQGEQAVHDSHADLVLVDPLYSAMLEARADLAPYRAAMFATLADGAADGSGTAVLDRYGLMRGWAQAGLFNIDHTPKPQRRATMARLDGCVGEMLARRVLAGASK
jgi:hypothetical protein